MAMKGLRIATRRRANHTGTRPSQSIASGITVIGASPATVYRPKLISTTVYAMTARSLARASRRWTGESPWAKRSM